MYGFVSAGKTRSCTLVHTSHSSSAAGVHEGSCWKRTDFISVERGQWLKMKITITRAFFPTLVASLPDTHECVAKGLPWQHSLVCQRECEGLCERNQAGWCKTCTGSDFCGSYVQFGDKWRTVSVAITLQYLSCDTLGLISSTLTRALEWHLLQF